MIKQTKNELISFLNLNKIPFSMNFNECPTFNVKKDNLVRVDKIYINMSGFEICFEMEQEKIISIVLIKGASKKNINNIDFAEMLKNIEELNKNTSFFLKML